MKVLFLNKKAKWIAATIAILLAAAVLCAVLLTRPDETPLQTASAAPTEAPTSTPTEAPTKPPELVTRVDPSCVEAGYTRYEDAETGVIRIEDGAPALGHSFVQRDSSRVCERCGYSEPVSGQSRLPRIELNGSMEGISKADRVLLDFQFESDETQFSCYANTSWQGHSSLENAKKNYTIRLFDDENLTMKHRLAFGSWHPEHKYVLKANYADATQSRNLICAHIWRSMAESRASLPDRLRSTVNLGAVDGFPVTVWVNGAFHGLYTMNLHKDDDLYDMRLGGRDAIMICNAQTMDEALFRAEAAFIEDQSDWEVEFATPEETQWAQQHFNSLIRFVMEADDETFRSNLAQQLDVDAAIDYLLFIYAMGLTDSAAKDLVMLTYDGGPWIPTVYDMEDAFGLSADGSSAKGPDAFLPSCQDGVWSSGTGSLLWDRLLQQFGDRIIGRWQELRGGVFSQEALTAQIAEMLDAVSEDWIQMDLELYPGRNLIQDPRNQIYNYMEQRLLLLDDVLTSDCE